MGKEEFARKQCEKLQNIALNVIASKLDIANENFEPSSILPVSVWRQVWQAFWPSCSKDDQSDKRQNNVMVRNVFRLFGSSSTIDWLDLRRFNCSTLEVSFDLRHVVTLNLSDTIFDKQIYVLIVMELSNVKELDLSLCENVDDVCMMEIASCCPDVEVLDITQTTISYMGIIKAIYSGAFSFLRTGGNTGPLSKLTSFKHSGDHLLRFDLSLTVKVILKNCPYLKCLVINDLTSCLSDISLLILEGRRQGIPCEPLKLTQIVLTHCEQQYPVPMDFYNELGLVCPDLEELEVDLVAIDRRDYDVPLQGDNRLPNLRRLKLMGSEVNTHYEHEHRFMNFVGVFGDNLTVLKLCYGISLHIPTILDYCPNLKKLCVTDSADTVPVGLFVDLPRDPQGVVKTYPNLIHFCHTSAHLLGFNYEEFGVNPFTIMPNLTELKLVKCSFLDGDVFLKRILFEERRLMSLECLYLDGRDRLTNITKNFILYLVHNLDKLPSLKTIYYKYPRPIQAFGQFGQSVAFAEERDGLKSNIRKFIAINNIDCKVFIS